MRESNDEDASARWKAFPCAGDELVGEREGHVMCTLTLTSPHRPTLSSSEGGRGRKSETQPTQQQEEEEEGKEEEDVCLLFGGYVDGDSSSDILLLSGLQQQKGTVPSDVPADSEGEELSNRPKWCVVDCDAMIGERDGAVLLSIPTSYLAPSNTTTTSSLDQTTLITTRRSSCAILFGGLSTDDYEYKNDLYLVAVSTRGTIRSEGGEEEATTNVVSTEEVDRDWMFHRHCVTSVVGDVPCPRARAAATLVCSGGKMEGAASSSQQQVAMETSSIRLFLFGGQCDEGELSDLYCLDLTKLLGAGGGVDDLFAANGEPPTQRVALWRVVETSLTAPSPRFGSVFVHTALGLLLVGGAYFPEPGTQRSSDEVWSLQITSTPAVTPPPGTVVAMADKTAMMTASWKRVTSFPTRHFPPTNGHTSFGGCGYVFGGKDTESGCDDLFLFSAPTEEEVSNEGESSNLPPPPAIQLRRFPPAIPHQDCISLARQESGKESGPAATAIQCCDSVGDGTTPHWRYTLAGAVVRISQGEGEHDTVLMKGKGGRVVVQPHLLVVAGQCRHPDPAVSYVLSLAFSGTTE